MGMLNIKVISILFSNTIKNHSQCKNLTLIKKIQMELKKNVEQFNLLKKFSLPDCWNSLTREIV